MNAIPARTVAPSHASITVDDDAHSLHYRIDAYDWHALAATLDEFGCAILPGLLDETRCRSVASLYERDTHFRSRVIMARHGFGRGEYKYFATPLPTIVQALRNTLYPRLVPIANRWHAQLGIDARFPDRHADFLDRCHRAGQTRPTPLLLRYREGDYNCLHQDLYGEHVFPLQAAVLLSRPGHDFTGGEFVMTEQRPRMQSRAEVVTLAQGDALVFAVNGRPRAGQRGLHRVNMRHGVSRLRSGERQMLGVIFHDAS
jgi:hypothetical protein